MPKTENGKTQETPTQTKKLPQMPEGYKKLGGEFPPFVYPEVGDVIHGTLKEVREDVEVELMKVGGVIGEVEKKKTYIVITLTEPIEMRATEKDPELHNYEIGKNITLSSSAVIQNAFRRAALERSGQNPYDENLVPNYSVLIGKKFWITRREDSLKKKGKFAGNKMKMFDVGIDEKDAARV